jgi:hypothetical protein
VRRDQPKASATAKRTRSSDAAEQAEEAESVGGYDLDDEHRVKQEPTAEHGVVEALHKAVKELRRAPVTAAVEATLANGRNSNTSTSTVSTTPVSPPKRWHLHNHHNHSHHYHPYLSRIIVKDALGRRVCCCRRCRLLMLLLHMFDRFILC